MHLAKVQISNFRSLEDFSVTFNAQGNLLVGPNAVGKTTVLEAMRLAKALLAPRTQHEGRTVLINLSVISNQLPQNFNFASIARDIQKPIIVNCDFKLTDPELADLPARFQELARAVTAAQTGISTAELGPLGLVQFLSTDAGKGALRQAETFVNAKLGEVAKSQTCKLHLTIDPTRSGISGADSFSQLLFTVLESRLSPFKTLFSYFPADRALPAGEAQIQLGSADAFQQLESHNSNPALKYQRLKNTIFGSIVEGLKGEAAIQKEFKNIFDKLLRGRAIEGFGVNQYGQAIISIKDLATGRVFDIDSMSSGEKGLILTFLLISRTMERGGVILLDEPELHLNPAVCKDLLGFLLDELLVPNDIQVIMCSHSAEIFGVAMRRDDCSTFHMRQGGLVSPVRKRDQSEVSQTLRLLGTSEVEEMLYDAVVFVEGDDDVYLLEEAFPDLLASIKFRELSGRGEIEKHIKRLQEAENKEEKENTSYFLFDHDQRPTALTSTPKVKIEQWDRYCLENYLLDTEILFDTLRKVSKQPPDNLGAAHDMFARLAKRQLRPQVIEEVYRGYNFEGLGIRVKDKHAENLSDAAKHLFDRVELLQKQIVPLQRNAWTREFETKCKQLLDQREQEWTTAWQEKCSGKLFLHDMRGEYRISVSLLTLKRNLLMESRLRDSENWKLFQTAFKRLIGLK